VDPYELQLLVACARLLAQAYPDTVGFHGDHAAAIRGLHEALHSFGPRPTFADLEDGVPGL
jgi:hypothetical protein